MSKKVIALIIVLVVVSAGSFGLLYMAYSAQYNSKGVSSLLNITIDENQQKEFVGKLDGYNIYVEGLKIDELYFIAFNDEQIPLKDAIDNELVSVKDWRKKARKTIKDGDAEILRYENYEIAIAYDDCIIRPISKIEG